MATKIVFTSKWKKKFRNAVLFTGLPGIGLVGKICVDYLLKQVKAEKIADISSDSFPPSVHTKNGLLELIIDELYLIKGDKRDFLFLAGPVQPSLDMRSGSPEEHYEFASAIICALEDKGVSEVCTLAGIHVGEKRMSGGQNPRVIVAATSKDILSEWQALGAVSDKPEGLITGAAGLIPAIAARHGIKGACLMGETNAKLVYGDPGSAKSILDLIVKKFGIKVKMAGIESDAKEIEKAFSELAKQLGEQPHASEPSEKLSYVR